MSQTRSDHPPPKPDPTTLYPDHAPYLKLDPNDVTTHSPPPPASDPSTEAPISGVAATSKPAESNTYVSPAPAPLSYFKNMALLGKWGKKTAETPKKGQDLAGNMWQQIALRTRVMAEGGYEKMFGSTFETTAEEQLLKSYACYLSTSSGRLMGGVTEWSYYKVVIPLHRLKAVNPSTSRANATEKHIQVISVDNRKFTFLGFLQYDSAVKNLRGSVPHHTLE